MDFLTDYWWVLAALAGGIPNMFTSSDDNDFDTDDYLKESKETPEGYRYKIVEEKW